MKVIYHGFDGLEFAIKANITKALNDELVAAQEQAKEKDEICAAQFGSEWLQVHSVGARGGYAFRCTHSSTGIWFFKKPSPNDPWGVRFSAASHALAIHGLEGVRANCKALLNTLGIDAPDNAYRPSRVDFAMDFIDPDFSPDPDLFVIHSRTGRKTIAEVDTIEVNAQSNHITSVTVGKMPGRQVIIYDKTLEVMAKRKAEWPVIWRNAMGADLNGARVWRIELRVAKRHLKDVWSVEGWASLYQLLERIYLKLLDDLRYCEISSDSNRSRWNEHPNWQALREVIKESLFDFIPTISASEYIELKRQQKIDELRMQALGLLTSVAAIEGVSVKEFETYLYRTAYLLFRTAQMTSSPLDTKLAKAAMRYSHLV